MSSRAAYRFNWDKSKLNQLKRNTINSMLNLGFKIAAEAQRGAPVGVYPKGSKKSGGSLLNSIRTTTNNKDEVLVLAGGSFSGKKIPYAKRREYENNKNPHTKYYMKNAFAWGEKNFASNFKGVTK